MDRRVEISDDDIDPAVALLRTDRVDGQVGIFLHQQRVTDFFKFLSGACVAIFTLQISEIPFHMRHILSGITSYKHHVEADNAQ